MSWTIKTAIKPVVNDFFAVIRRMKQILVIVYITAEEFVDSMMSKWSKNYKIKKKLSNIDISMFFHS